MRWVIRPGIGLGDLLFGSSREEVMDQLGEPDEATEDLLAFDTTLTWNYVELAVSARFDGEDGFRLVSLQTGREDVDLHGRRLIGLPESRACDLLSRMSLGPAEFELLRFSDFPSLGWLRYDVQGLNFWFKRGRRESIQWNPLIGPDDRFAWPEEAR